MGWTTDRRRTGRCRRALARRTRWRATSTFSMRFATSGRALGARQGLERDRVDLLVGTGQDENDRARGFASGRSRHDLQTDRGGTGPLAIGQRHAPRRGGVRRRCAPEGGVGESETKIRQVAAGSGGRASQRVLTSAHSPAAPPRGNHLAMAR
jgi:hypothetical protein